MSIASKVEKFFVGMNARVYRASGGKMWAKIGQAPILLLTTTGRKSGQPRTSPLCYLDDGGRYVVVGSHRGSETHPAWVFNLRANPEASVEIGSEHVAVTASEVSDAEREQVWPKMVAMYPDYDSYTTKTSRKFPLFALTPKS